MPKYPPAAPFSGTRSEGVRTKIAPDYLANPGKYWFPGYRNYQITIPPPGSPRQGQGRAARGVPRKEKSSNKCLSKCFGSIRSVRWAHHISRIRGRLAPFLRFFSFSITLRLSVVLLPPFENGHT